MNGKTRNLVAIISEEKGHSNNKAIEIVHKILLNKSKEVQIVIIQLQIFAKSNDEITTL
jgi:hypothetical protein